MTPSNPALTTVERTKTRNGVAQKFVWYWRRFRCMPKGELLHRLRQFASFKAHKFCLVSLTHRDTPDISSLADTPAYIPPELASIDPYVDEANRIATGDVYLFASHDFHVGATPNWNQDPLTKTVGPSSFGPDIPITAKQVVGDIKYIWELNRHLHLVRLAQAYALTEDRRYLAFLAAQLESWLDQCPPYKGPNWNSALELGIRLINWTLIWKLVGGKNSSMFADSPLLLGKWLPSIHAHCEYIARHHSAYSSANNHLIGELAGLFVAATTWNCWVEAKLWAQNSHAALSREAQLQFAADGVNLEQASSYQVFSTEFLLVAGMQGNLCDMPFAMDFWSTIQQSADFLAATRNVTGRRFMFGDADDGAVWYLEKRDTDRAQSLINTVSAIGDSLESRQLCDTTKWLFSIFGETSVDLHTRQTDTWAFAEGGYFAFGSNIGEPNEVKGIVDCGPLGYLGIAAHGHADALSLVLSISGEDCLIDPGTYSYWKDIEWRDYFRGTSAHNTLRIDGLDQSVGGGRFMWTEKAACKVNQFPASPTQFSLIAEHDGYQRLNDPITHTREIQYDGSSAVLTVKDSTTGKCEHLFEQFWHVAPTVIVERISPSKLQLKGNKFCIEMLVDGSDHNIDIFTASQNPIAGWYSSAYEHIEPTTTLRISHSSRVFSLLVTFVIQTL